MGRLLFLLLLLGRASRWRASTRRRGAVAAPGMLMMILQRRIRKQQDEGRCSSSRGGDEGGPRPPAAGGSFLSDQTAALLIHKRRRCARSDSPGGEREIGREEARTAGNNNRWERARFSKHNASHTSETPRRSLLLFVWSFVASRRWRKCVRSFRSGHSDYNNILTYSTGQ